MTFEIDRIIEICRIITAVTDLDVVIYSSENRVIFENIINKIPQFIRNKTSTVQHIKTLPQDVNRIYQLTDGLNLNSIYLPVKTSEGDSAYIFTGPFLLDSEFNFKDLDNSLKQVPSAIQENVIRYFKTLNIFDLYRINGIMDNIFTLVNPLLPNAEHEVIRISNRDIKSETSLNINRSNYNQSFRNIEKIYSDENKLLKAVEIGDTTEALNILKTMNEPEGESKKISTKPLRNYKSMLIVLSTLLRKAAENAGVHPYYIDSFSWFYTSEIEKKSRIDASITAKMITDYCTLVNNYSIPDYSPQVKNLIEYIRINSNRDLKLKELAHLVNSSPSNVSRKFKRETSESIVDYINRTRIEESLKMIKTGRYNITEIAFNVGFNDANYFSKIFKKITGLTPKNYRDNRERLSR